MKKLLYVITMIAIWIPSMFGMHAASKKKVTTAVQTTLPEHKTKKLPGSVDTSLVEQLAHTHISAPKNQEVVQETKEEKSDEPLATVTPIKPYRERPSFVANAPVYVPSNDESDETDSETDDTFEFTQEDFDNPPFSINGEKRGTVAILIKAPHIQSNTVQPSCIQPLCDKLSQHGFVEPHAQQQAIECVSATFGLNRPRSLSLRKNKLLKQELNKKITTHLHYRVFGMLWDFPWMKKKADGPFSISSYKEVKSFYQQLKKIDLQKARTFRRNVENNAARTIRRIVPYRSLRETVKNNDLTKELVQIARKNNPQAPVYLFFCDGDTIDFNGCFTAYTQLVQEKAHIPTAMTTGYMFALNNDQHPMITFANELDMCVREATAQFIPRGVYYPEPSLCILVIEEEISVDESFERGSERDYSASQESPIILGQVAQRAHATFIFGFHHPLITATPLRATTQKAKTRDGKQNLLKFDAEFNSSSTTFENWSMHDLTNCTFNTAQSHASGRNWAINILNAFEMESNVDVLFLFPPCEEGKTIGAEDVLPFKVKNKSIVRDMVISLLSRLFNSYNPISLANGNVEELKTMLSDHDKYQEKISSGMIPANNESTRKRAADTWEIVDAAMRLSFFKHLLSDLLKDCDADAIDAAARNAGQAMWNLLSKRLAH